MSNEVRMPKPVNGYVLIDPLVHESFTASSSETYDEIGTVIECSTSSFTIGSKVYFDSFMAKKYPNPTANDKFIYLVHKDEISAVMEA